MSWQERIREAAYTSPSGERITFDYEDVKKVVDKRTVGFEFPDVDGTYVQDLGVSGRKFPLRVFFWGADYDKEAALFEAALVEQGIGKLEHPAYGTANVVPFGKITRHDALASVANQAIVEVVFWETIGLIYPSSQTDPASAVIESVEEFNEAATSEFAEETSLSTAVEQAEFKNSYSELIDGSASGLRGVASTQEDVRQKFETINDSIQRGLNAVDQSVGVLLKQPLELAAQTIRLIQAPARALTSIEARLQSYRELLDKIFGKDDDYSNSENGFRANDLYSSAYVTGCVISVVNHQFATKTKALEAADWVLGILSDFVKWRDDRFKTLGVIDTGATYQKLQQSVSLAAGFLVEISFTLKQERKIVLDRDRTIIDLVAELYGEIDTQLDFFIDSNDLSGSEILELKKGRAIVYYI